MKSLRAVILRKTKKLGLALGTLSAHFKGVDVGKGTKVSPGAIFDLDDTGSIRIGNKCRIHHGVLFATHRNGVIQLGDGCSVNPYCVLYGHGGLIIGDRVRIAAHCVFIPANHRFSMSDGQFAHEGLSRVGIRIGNDVWIGTGVRVLDGVTIGDEIIVGAGSVVTKPLLKKGVYAGVPAKFIREHG